MLGYGVVMRYDMEHLVDLLSHMDLGVIPCYTLHYKMIGND